MSGRVDSKIYIGDLPRDAEEREIDRAFGSFGRVRSVWVARNPPGFAFVEMEDRRDAEEAVKRLDGGQLCGVRVRVEMSTGRSRPKNFNSGGPRRGFDPNDRCYECGNRGHYAKNCDRRRPRNRSRSRSFSPNDRRNRSSRRSPSYNDKRSVSRSVSRSPPPRRKRSDSASSGGYSR